MLHGSKIHVKKLIYIEKDKIFSLTIFTYYLNSPTMADTTEKVIACAECRVEISPSKRNGKLCASTQ